MSARAESGPGRHDSKSGPPADRRPQPSELQRRYPAGVSVCTTPEEYVAAMRDAGLWVRLTGTTGPTLLRFEGEWTRYTGRVDEPPEATVLSESAVLARLREDVPVLVTPREARRLLDPAPRRAGTRPGGEPR